MSLSASAEQMPSVMKNLVHLSQAGDFETVYQAACRARTTPDGRMAFIRRTLGKAKRGVTLAHRQPNRQES